VQAVHKDGVMEEICSKVNFSTGDSCQVSEMASSGQLSSCDGIVVSNLLCRLPSPWRASAAFPPF
jgi:hypothetical protein